jgi:hypothetical protein
MHSVALWTRSAFRISSVRVLVIARTLSQLTPPGFSAVLGKAFPSADAQQRQAKPAFDQNARSLQGVVNQSVQEGLPTVGKDSTMEPGKDRVQRVRTIQRGR